MPEDNSFPTFEKLSRDAIAAQTSTDLPSLAHNMAIAAYEIKRLVPKEKPEFYNQHPVMVLYAYRIAELSGCRLRTNYSEALETCRWVVKTGAYKRVG